MKLPPNDGTSERQYLHLVQEIIDHGFDEFNERTGEGTRKIHGATMRFDLSDDSIPLLTTKEVRWKDIFHELNWFLSGSTNIRDLLLNKVTIWSEWPHKKYVHATGDHLSVKEFEKRVLADEAFAHQWGSIGKGYGYQWRHWEGKDGVVYDQISDVIRQIKTTPASRRMLFHAWNVAELNDMALPPCHLLYQFFVANGQLSLTMYQRSCDVGLGLPYNLASCGMLVRLVAQQCGLKPGSLFWVGHDVHLYQNHIEILQNEQLTRTPRPLPKFKLTNIPPSLFDYTIDHVALVEYDPYPKIKLPVAV